jgi:hypothetical protein
VSTATTTATTTATATTTTTATVQSHIAAVSHWLQQCDRLSWLQWSSVRFLLLRNRRQKFGENLVWQEKMSMDYKDDDSIIRPLSCRLRLKCDGTRAETRFRLSAKRTSPFKSAGTSVQSTTDSRCVRISGSNAGYTMFRGSVKSTGYPIHSTVSPSLPLPCVTVCHHISTGLYMTKP